MQCITLEGLHSSFAASIVVAQVEEEGEVEEDIDKEEDDQRPLGIRDNFNLMVNVVNVSIICLEGMI